MQAHLRQEAIMPAHFIRWLSLFRATAEDLFPPAIAQAFVLRAENIARSLQLGMFFRPDSTPATA